MQNVAVAPKPAEEVRWTKCPACDAFVYHKRLERNLKVCPECNYHFRLPMRERLAQLLDEGSFTELSGEIETVDVLGFVDSKPYRERLQEAQRKTGNRDAAIYGPASIGGQPVVVASMDFAFMGGSMGGAVGEVITRAAELALDTHTPLLVISASGGARMQEGCVSLMQLAKTSQAIARLHEAGVLYLSLLTDPTTGGVSASFATLGDVLIAEPNALIGFAGPSIIEQTIRQKLPAGFQSSGFLMDHGMLDLVVPRETLRRLLQRILRFHEARPNPSLPATSGAAPVKDSAQLRVQTPWETVELARNIARPNTSEYVARVFDDFEEFHGDRLFREDAAIVGGLAKLGDLTVMVIGHQKGHTTAEMVERNFGMPYPEGYRKALRLMQYAARFGMPIVTFVDTPGAYPGIGAEERGQSIAVAEGIMEMSRLPVPIVTIVMGEGGSGGALALAVGDRVLMMENAYYSVISPEGCSVILWKNAAAAPQAAAALRVTAPDLLRLRIMDGVVPEPEGGAHADPATAAANLQTAIITALQELLSLSREELLTQRYQRFRRLGTPGEQPDLASCNSICTYPACRRRTSMTTDATGGRPADEEIIRSFFREAADLIKRLEGSSVRRLALEAAGYKVEIERGGLAPAGSGAEAPLLSGERQVAAAQPGAPDNRHAVVAPLVGTFYRSGQPGAKPFVEIGTVVDQGQAVAIVEAMKIMNQILAEQRGRVAEILVKDGDWVEFQQPLMYLEPIEE